MSRGGPRGRPRREAGHAPVAVDLLVFVEGARTEEHYIVHWARRHRDRANVSVAEFRGGPLQLVEHAVAAKKQQAADEKRGRGRSYDDVWCVFDVDEHPNLKRAIQLAQEHGIHLAVSNPCLELWFVLHFRQQTAFIDRADAQRDAAHLLGCSKALTQHALDALVERFADAAQRARALDAKHEGDGSPRRSNPSSGVPDLIDRIRG